MAAGPRRSAPGAAGRPNPLTAILRGHGLWGPARARSSSRTRSSPSATSRSPASSRCSTPATGTSTPPSATRRSATRRSASGSRTTSSTCCCASASSARSGPCAARSTRGRSVKAREVRITDRAGLEEFSRRVPVIGKLSGLELVMTRGAARAVNSNLDTLPVGGLGSGHRVQGRPLMGRDQRRRRPATQPQLARPLARPVAPPARPARRGHRQPRARDARHLGPVVGRGRLDRVPRRAGDLRSDRSRASTTSSRTTSSSTTAR